jgi:hypothetical protein
MKKCWNFSHEVEEGAKGIEYIIFSFVFPFLLRLMRLCGFYSSNVLDVTVY